VIQVSQEIGIPDEDVQIAFIRASGPGGQNVNKVSSAVQLRFDTHSQALPEDVRLRLIRLAGKRINQDGELVIEASSYRMQEQNRQAAIERLSDLIQKAAQKPKVRRKTEVPLKVRERRLEAKRCTSEKKRLRRRIDNSYNGS
jgi:ribosome-associated protein